MSRGSASASGHASPGAPNGAQKTAASVLPPIMTIEEVNLLVHAFLQESGFTHTAFSLLHESTLGASSSRRDAFIPPSHLLRVLQKGLLYMDAESRYKGEENGRAPRLIGYEISDTLPLPPMPKYLSEEEKAAVAAIRVRGKMQAVMVQTETVVVMSEEEQKALVDAKGKKKAKSQDSESQTANQEVTPLPPPPPSKTYTEMSVQTDPPIEPPAPPLPKTSHTVATNTNPTALKLSAPPKSANSAIGKRKASDVSSDMFFETKRTKTDEPTASTSKPSSKASLPSSVANPNSKRKPSADDTFNNSSKAPTKVRRSLSPSVARSSAASSLVGDRKLVAFGKSRDPPGNSGRAPSLPIGKKEATPPVAGSSKNSNNKLLSANSGSTTKSKKPSPGEDKKSKKLSPAPPTATSSGSRLSRRIANAIVPGASLDEPVQFLSDADTLQLKGHNAQTAAGAWHPTSSQYLATAGVDGCMRIWDLGDGKVGREEGDRTTLEKNVVCDHKTPGSRKCEVVCVAWNHDGTLLATGTDMGLCRVWMATGELVQILPMHQKRVYNIAWTPNGTQVLTAAADTTLCLWDLGSGKVKQQWTTHQGAQDGFDMEAVDDSHFVSCASDKVAHLIAYGKPHPIHRFKGHSEDINTLKLSPSKTLVATAADDHDIRIWSLAGLVPGIPVMEEAEEGEEVEEGSLGNEKLLKRKGSVVALDFGSEVLSVEWGKKKKNLLLGLGTRGLAKLFNWHTGQTLMVIERHTEGVLGGFHPGNEEFIVTAGAEGTVCVWRISDGVLVCMYDQKQPIWQVAWCPTRPHIAICGSADTAAVLSVKGKL